MKKHVFIFAMMLSAVTSFAQISRSSILLSGSSNLNFSTFHQDGGRGESSRHFIFKAKGGYFVLDNFVLGLNLGYERYDLSARPNETTIGAFGRYYIVEKVIVGVGLNTYTSKYYDVVTVPIEVGYAAFIHRNIALEPAFVYEFVSGDSSGWIGGLNFGITFFLNRN